MIRIKGYTYCGLELKAVQYHNHEFDKWLCMQYGQVFDLHPSVIGCDDPVLVRRLTRDGWWDGVYKVEKLT